MTVRDLQNRLILRNHRRILRLAAIAGLVAALTSYPSAGASRHDSVFVVTSGPGAQFYGYIPPAVLTQKGGLLTYINLDVARHDVVQDTKTDGVAGPSKKPWCKEFGKKACPIFWTPQIGIGQQTEVLGLESVEPGATYSFLCTLHPGMKGTLVVLP